MKPIKLGSNNEIELSTEIKRHSLFLLSHTIELAKKDFHVLSGTIEFLNIAMKKLDKIVDAKVFINAKDSYDTKVYDSILKALKSSKEIISIYNLY